MITFDPTQPAILHDRVNDTIQAWTGEDAQEYQDEAVMRADGAVEWRDFIFDGWGNVLGG